MELVLTNIVFAAKTSIPMTHSDHSNSFWHQLTLDNNYQLWLTTYNNHHNIHKIESTLFEKL
jgi:hypothetical protein